MALVAAPAAATPPGKQCLPSAEQIIAGVVKRSEKQDYEIQGYSVVRRYTLRNHHLSADAGVTVQWEYQAGRGKQFIVEHTEGASVAQHAILRLIKEEEQSSQENPLATAVNPSNYQFTLEGEETHEGRLCYRFRVVPREKSKMLIDGEAWVDVQELAVVALEGHPAKNLSFWVGRPYVEQHFAPVHGFWMPSWHRTTAQVTLAGETELTIEYWDYKFNLPTYALRTP